MKIRSVLVIALVSVASSIIGKRLHAQDFSIVVIPDTQYYTYPSPYTPDPPPCSPQPNCTQDAKTHAGFGNQNSLNSQTQWIVANQANPNHLPFVAPIAYVAHLGDLVENGDCFQVDSHGYGMDYGLDYGQCPSNRNTSQWQSISQAMGILDSAGIPYGVAVGNHDQSPLNGGPGSVNTGVGSFHATTTTLFNQTFPPSHWSGKAYYGGSYKSGLNNSHFDLITAGGQSYIIIYLEYDDNGAGIDNSSYKEVHDPGLIPWAANLVSTNPSKKAIIVTHYAGTGDKPANFGDQGQRIYDALKGYSNFFLMVGGHVPAASRRQDLNNNTGFSADTVSTLVSDYQDDACTSATGIDCLNAQSPAGEYEAGDGFFRVYTISNSHNTLTATTPTNWSGEYSYATSKTDANNAFQIQLRWSSRLDIFYRSKVDNTLGQIWWNGAGWGGPQSLGGTLTSDPGATSRGANLLDVFYRGSNGNLTWKAWNGTTWSAETDMGVAISGAPAAASRGLFRMDVFYRGADNSLQQIQWNGTVWTPQPSLGGALASDPAAVSWGTGNIDVVYKAADNSVRHRAWNGSTWAAEENLHGTIAGKPGIASRASGMLDVFGQTSAGAPYHCYYPYGTPAGWSGWGLLPGTANTGNGGLTGSPSAASWGDGVRVDDVFAGTGANPQLWEDYWNGSAWTAQPLGGTPAGAPAVASWSHF